MNVGSIVFATDQGLGYLARDFYNHGIVTHPLLLAHGRRPDHWDWYPEGTERLPTHRGERSIDAFSQYLKNKQISHMLFFETPFNWDFLAVCRDAGVKSILMPMHECMPAVLPALPDLWLAPSKLDVRWACSKQADGPAGNRAPVRFLPVPVPDEVQFRQRDRVRLFVHNAGNGGQLGRNGTAEVIEAWKYVRSDAHLLLRAQDPTVIRNAEMLPKGRATVVPHHVPAEALYAEGDVFLFPEKFNGLSLPLQEAYASGMVVMCADRYPMNDWLPREPLVPVRGTRPTRIAGHLAEFDEAIIDPKDIAAKVDYWYDSDISVYGASSQEWRRGMSWTALASEYLELISKV